MTSRWRTRRILCGWTNFYWLHAAYFGALSVAGTMSLWWCRERKTISFVDCIYNAVSALTTTGLSSVLLRDFTTLGMFILVVLMLLGNNIFTSVLTLYICRFQSFRHNRALKTSIAVKSDSSPTNSNHSIHIDHAAAIVSKEEPTKVGLAMDHNPRTGRIAITMDKGGKIYLDGTNVGSVPNRNAEDIACISSHSDRLSIKQSDSKFDAISSLEHQAIVTLCWLVPLYMLVLLFVGFLAILCYNIGETSSGIMKLYKAERVNPTFTAMFLSTSAFTNTGTSPLDENMVPFKTAPLVLIPLAFIILGGNIMFPHIIRVIIWGLYHLKRKGDPQRDVYEYLLQHPCRCFTHLFPQLHTMWLLLTVLAFNAVDLVVFCAFDWNSEAVTAGLPMSAGAKLMAGVFQSLNTRSAGMNIVTPLSALSPPLQVIYVVMMYVKVYPVFLSRQYTRVTRNDNFYQDSFHSVDEKNGINVEDNKFSVQSRKLLARDSAYIIVHFILICTIEMRSINSDPLNYSIFSIVFEVISAYGNVGLSLGYSCEQWVRASVNTAQATAAAACKEVPYSFSGKWRVGSKLILVAIMLLGRHRGVPNDIDFAISFMRIGNPDYPDDDTDLQNVDCRASSSCSPGSQSSDNFHSTESRSCSQIYE